MKLSTKCRYGARAVLEIARNYRDGPIKRRDIVKSQQISDSYLENILITLKNGGVINTIRGANGGYLLCRPPKEITLFEIVTLLEGSLAPVECLDNISVCAKTDKCATRVVWDRLRKAKEDVLKDVTVQDLVDLEDKPAKSDYSI